MAVDKLEPGEMYTTTYFALSSKSKYIFVDVEHVFGHLMQYTFYNINKNRNVSCTVNNQSAFLKTFDKI